MSETRTPPASGHHGRLELTWTDKEKTLLSVGDGRYDYQFVAPADRRVSEVRLLHEVDRVEAPTPPNRPDSLPVPTTKNLLIRGDSMHALDALSKVPELADEYLGKVRLVYIDPPFNTGQTFDNYEDNIEHSIWLTMLRDRLRQVKPLLAPNGSIWVHLDDAEVHRCRCVLDEEMGPQGFISQVIWQKRTSRENRAAFSESHDTILIYSPMPKASWRHVRNRLPRTGAATNPDNDPNGPWDSIPFTAQGHRANQMYLITTPTGVVHGPPPGRCWGAIESEYLRLLDEGRIYFPKQGDGKPRVKQYEHEAKGLVPHTIWTVAEVGDNDRAKKEIMALFPGRKAFATPKPESLLRRVVEIATDPGDIVLDFFVGSGTTAAVAHKLGRRWVAVELQPETVSTYTKPRLARVVRGEDPGGISTTTSRVPAEGAVLPDGLTAKDAQLFQTLLSKVVTATEGDDLDEATLRALRDVTRTRNNATTNWHGGGGFTHLEVGPSMFLEIEGVVLLADWAVQGELTKAMCAQLGVRYSPDGIFAGRRAKVRYVVVDGMVAVSTIETVLDQLGEGLTVEVWATQVAVGAREALVSARPGSRVESIPDAVLDDYRRKSARTSPFTSSRLKETS